MEGEAAGSRAAELPGARRAVAGAGTAAADESRPLCSGEAIGGAPAPSESAEEEKMVALSSRGGSESAPALASEQFRFRCGLKFRLESVSSNVRVADPERWPAADGWTIAEVHAGREGDEGNGNALAAEATESRVARRMIAWISSLSSARSDSTSSSDMRE